MQHVSKEIKCSRNMTGCFSVTLLVEKIFTLPDDDISE